MLSLKHLLRSIIIHTFAVRSRSKGNGQTLIRIMNFHLAIAIGSERSFSLIMKKIVD